MRLSPRKRCQGRWLAILLALVLTMSNLSTLSLVYADEFAGSEITDNGNKENGDKENGGNENSDKENGDNENGNNENGNNENGNNENGDNENGNNENGDNENGNNENGNNENGNNENGDNENGNNENGNNENGNNENGNNENGNNENGGNENGNNENDGNGNGNNENNDEIKENQLAIEQAQKVIDSFKSYDSISNHYLNITAATSSDLMKVGEEFTVKINTKTNLNDKVMYPTNAVAAKDFTQNGFLPLKVKVKLPLGIAFVPKNDDNTITYSEDDRTVSISFSGIKSGNAMNEFTAYIEGNGTTPASTGKLIMPVTAEGDLEVITAYDASDKVLTSKNMPFKITGSLGETKDSLALLEVEGTAEGEWGIEKDAVKAEITADEIGDTFEVSYTVKAGKLKEGFITTDAGAYDDVGQLIFETVNEANSADLDTATGLKPGDDYFYIKESIPVVSRNNELKSDIKPIEFKVSTKTSGDGTKTLIDGKNSEGFNQNELMAYFNELNSINVSDSHHFAKDTVAFETEYTVTLVYKGSDVTIGANESAEIPFVFTNTAEMTYKMPAGEVITKTGTATVTAIKQKAPVSIEVQKMLEGSMDGLYNRYPVGEDSMKAFGLTVDSFKNLKFALYEINDDGTQGSAVKDLNGNGAAVVLSEMDGNGIFRSPSAQTFLEGTYFIKEEGSLAGFETMDLANANDSLPAGVEYVEAGLYKVTCNADRTESLSNDKSNANKARVPFYNKAAAKGSLMVFKQSIKDGEHIPCANIEFGVFEQGGTKAIAKGETIAPTGAAAGRASINNIPLDTGKSYQLKEILKGGDKDKYTDDSQNAVWDITFDDHGMGSLTASNDEAKNLLKDPNNLEKVGTADNPIVNIPRYGTLKLFKTRYSLKATPTSGPDSIEKNNTHFRLDGKSSFIYEIYKGEDAKTAVLVASSDPTAEAPKPTQPKIDAQAWGPIKIINLTPDTYWVKESNKDGFFMWSPKKQGIDDTIGPFVVEAGDTEASYTEGKYKDDPNFKIANFQDPLGFAFRKVDGTTIVPSAKFNLFKVDDIDTKEDLAKILSSDQKTLEGKTLVQEGISVIASGEGNGFRVIQGLPSAGKYALVEYEVDADHILPKGKDCITIVDVVAPKYQEAVDNATEGADVISALKTALFTAQGWKTDGGVNTHIKNAAIKRLNFYKNGVDGAGNIIDSNLAGATFIVYEDHGVGAKAPRFTQVMDGDKALTFTTEAGKDHILKLDPSKKYAFYESKAPEGYDLPTTGNTPAVNGKAIHVPNNSFDKAPSKDNSIVLFGPVNMSIFNNITVNNSIRGGSFNLAKIAADKDSDLSQGERPLLGGAEFKLYAYDGLKNITLSGKYYDGKAGKWLTFDSNNSIKTEAGQATKVIVKLPNSLKSKTEVEVYLQETKAPEGYINGGGEAPDRTKDPHFTLAIGSVDTGATFETQYVQNKLDENIKLTLTKYNRSKAYYDTNKDTLKVPLVDATFTLYQKDSEGKFVPATEREDSDYGKWQGATQKTAQLTSFASYGTNAREITPNPASLSSPAQIIWEKLRPGTDTVYAIAEEAMEGFHLTDVQYKQLNGEFKAAEVIEQDGKKYYVLPEMQNGQNLEVEAYNHPTGSKLVINKVNEDKQAISQKAEFEIYKLLADVPDDLMSIDLDPATIDKTKVVLVEDKDFVFDNKGTYTMLGLPEGEYLLVETEAPAGYAIVDKYPSRYRITVDTTGKGSEGVQPKADLVGGVVVTDEAGSLVYTTTIVNKSSAAVDKSMEVNIKKETTSNKLIKDSLSKKEQDIKYNINEFAAGQNEKTYTSFEVEDTGLKFYTQSLSESKDPINDPMEAKSEDYTFTSLDIGKAEFSDIDSKRLAAKARVSYKTAGEAEYTLLGDYILTDQSSTVDLSQINNVTSIKVAYGYGEGETFTEGVGRYFNAGNGITVRGKLKQRNPKDTRGEVFGIRNTAKISASEGKTQYDKQATSDINVEATAMFPWIQLKKDHVDASGNILNQVPNYNINDKIYYKLTVELAEGSPEGISFEQPILVDKLPPALGFESAIVMSAEGLTKVTNGVSDLTTLKGTEFADGQDYVTLFFDGSLAKGNKLEILLTTTLRSDRTGSRKPTIDNKAFVASRAQDPYVLSNNALKAKFMNANGAFPQKNDVLDFELVNAIGLFDTVEGVKQPVAAFSANQSIATTRLSQVSIEKSVKGSAPYDGSYRQEARVVNNKPYSYRIDILNTTDAEMNNIMVAELLPAIGDKINTQDVSKNRGSQWRPQLYNGFGSGASFDYEGFNGNDGKGDATDFNNVKVYSVAFDSDNPTEENVKSAFDKVKKAVTQQDTDWASEGWQNGLGDDISKVGAFALQLDGLTIKAQGRASILVSMKVPEWDFQTESKNTQKQAVADAMFTYSLAGEEGSALSSNRVEIWAEPEPVGVGDRVWLDKNGDGIQDDDEEGLSAAPVSLSIYKSNGSNPYNVKNTFSRDDGIYQFDQLSPKGDVEKLNDQFKLTFKTPKYAMLTSQYSGNNGAIPNESEFPKTVGDEGYTANGRATDSNAKPEKGSTEYGSTERFWLNPRPDSTSNAALTPEQKGFDLTYDCGIIPLRNIGLKKTNTKGEGIEGAIFKLYLPEDKDTFVTATSDSDGKVFFNANSKDNKGADFNIFAFKEYSIQETSAPEGFVLDNTVYTVKHYEDPDVPVTYKNMNDGKGLSTNVGEIKNLSLDEEKAKTRDISIEKVQLGGTEGEDFRFIVHENGNLYKGSYNIADNVFNATDGIVILKGGEKAVIKLPVESTYTVEEEQNEQYTVSHTGELSGTISADSVQDIVFTNTWKPTIGPSPDPDPEGPKPDPDPEAPKPTPDPDTEAPKPTPDPDPEAPKPTPDPDTEGPTTPDPDTEGPTTPGGGGGGGGDSGGGGGGGNTDNPTTPETPNRPAPPTEYEPGNTPDPNAQNAPEEIIVVDETGVPLAFFKALDPVTEEYIYVDEQGVPLANMILEDPEIPMANMVLEDAALVLVSQLPQTGQKSNGEGIFLGLGVICILGALTLRKKEI